MHPIYLLGKRLFVLPLLLFSLIANAQPNANFSATVTSGCPPLTVQFMDQSTGNPSSWSWNWGAGSSVLQNPTAVFTTPGTYTVTLTATNGSGSDMETKTAYITVRDTPVVNFTVNPANACPGTPVQFTNTTVAGGPGPNVYSWAYGDGSPFDPTQNPSHIYYLPGTKNVTLQVTNVYNCTRSVTKNAFVNIFPKPDIDFSGNPTTACSAPMSVSFNAIPNGAFTYSWKFGDGNTANTANPSNTYAGPPPASYNVSLEITDANGCKDTMLKNGFINMYKITANFTAPASACVGTAVNFTSTSTPAVTSVTWDFADGSGTHNGTPINHIFYTPGTYEVTMTAYNGPCPDVVKKTIIIHPQPTVDFTINPPNPCPAPQTITFIPSGTATNYTWDFGDGSPTSSATSPTHTYTNNGYYTPTLYVTNANGCKDTIVKPDYVKIRDGDLSVFANKAGGCIPVTIQFNNTLMTNIPAPGPIPYPFGVTSYSWTFGDGGTSNLANPAYTYTTVGEFWAKLTVITSNGCTFMDSVKIKTGIPPVASFTAVPTLLCAGQPVVFTNTSTGAQDYLWTFGDGESTTAVNPIHYYDTVGEFTVILTAIYNFCEDTYKVVKMIKTNPPTAEFDFKYSCDTPLKVKFTNNSEGATSFIWSFGDNTTNTTDANPAHIYPGPGNYTVRLVTFNSAFGCSDTINQVVTLVIPTANFTANDTTICKDEKVQFTGTLTNGTAGTYMWYVDNVYMTDSFGTYTHLFTTTGYHTVSVTIYDDHACPQTKTRTNYVRVSKPTVDFTATPVVGCPPLAVNFTDQSTATTGTSLANRTWYFGSTGPFSYPGPTAASTFASKGDYDVKLIVTDNNGCKDSLTKPAFIDVNKPTAAFIANDVIGCIKQTIQFDNTSADHTSSAWDFGDGGTSLQDDNVDHSYASTGSFTVRLIVTDQWGCKDTATKPGYITITKPTASFYANDSFAICPPLQVTFTNTSANGVSAWWDFGTMNTAVQNNLNQNVNEVYSTAGYFKVIMAVKNSDGCTDTAIGHIDVLGYSGSLSYTPLTGCAPLDVMFTTAVNNVPSIVYDFSDGVVQQVAGAGTITHTYTTPGAYLPKLILSDGVGCASSSLGDDTIKVDGVLGGFIHSPACEGYVVKFDDTSKSFFTPISTRAWTFHDNTTSSISNPSHYYPKAGTYPVHVIITNSNGCKDTVEKDIVVHPLPVISAGEDTTICLNDAAQLMGSGGTSYQWSPASTLNCNDCPNPLAKPTVKTEYTVIGTDANQCSDTDRVIISLKTKTDSEIGEGGEICDKEAIQLHASGAQRYEWYPKEDMDNWQSADPFASPHTTTNVMVIAFEGSCIPDTNFALVTVHPLPDVTATGTATIIAGQETPLQASGSLIKRFEWTPGESLSCTNCSAPLAKPYKTTEYTITVYSEYECVDSDKVTITVLCDESQLYVPNTFTPNGDGQNDVFYPRGNGLDKIRSFRVYNRWGEVVYERSVLNLNDRSNGWDGTVKGNAVAPDVFVWTMEADCEGGEVMKLKGDVTLVR